MKDWINKAKEYLQNCLKSIPLEINELEWKETLSPNNEKLKQHLSAFANQPAGGFIVFGIENKNGEILGITKEQTDLITQRLSNLGRDSLNPEVVIDHSIEDIYGKPLLFIYIKESAIKPVHLKSGTIEDAYIRSGGTTRKASRHEIGGLMLNSKTPRFEELHASKVKTADKVLDTLNYRGIYNLLGKPVSTDTNEILKWMSDEKMIVKINGDGFYITNFGAISCAYNLNEFDGLARKVIRLIKYDGKNKLKTEREYTGKKGYAIGFKGLISFVKAMLPASEIIEEALRRQTSVYPEIALRELIANALIHQDFTIRGSGPMIEIFGDRIEISNPGKLLPSKSIDRLIRTSPESRNEILASAFRRYNICEERGSGLEKTVTAIEVYGLPPVKFEELENSFRVTIYSPRKFAQMSKNERIEACYQHSIIKYYSDEGGMTNKSLRERFKMNDEQRPQISKIIKEAKEAGKIKNKDPESKSDKHSKYVPFWA